MDLGTETETTISQELSAKIQMQQQYSSHTFVAEAVRLRLLKLRDFRDTDSKSALIFMREFVQIRADSYFASPSN